MIGNISGYNAYNAYDVSLNYATKINASKEFEKIYKAKELDKTGEVECQTCKDRKYQDGSNEGNVSFKAPGHISPEASASVVMAHEGEHVANAFSKAAQNNGKVVSASVSLQTGVCSECGKTYVAGGTTRTQIKYNEENPYDRNKKIADETVLKGMNIDYAA